MCELCVCGWSGVGGVGWAGLGWEGVVWAGLGTANTTPDQPGLNPNWASNDTYIKTPSSGVSKESYQLLSFLVSSNFLIAINFAGFDIFEVD